ncbi:MAG: class I SAM-dependent methyltransferase [Candidatus Omnitrophica bacterium]|nr:class I SAM-dependent methyltransferase [Candidatus Omnitrophota bacterium]
MTQPSFTQKIRAVCVNIFKTLDKWTNYHLGSHIRRITNTNTRKHWDKRAAEYGNFIRDYPYQDIIACLPSAGAFSLLDIGCAIGDGCIFMKKHFPKATIHGADFSPVAVEMAKGKADNINFYVCDILKDSLPQKYDYITMASTIEHFNDPYQVVRKCLKYVYHGVLIYTPYTEKFLDGRLYGRGEHRFLFNANSFNHFNCEVVNITAPKPTGYRYIIYKIAP